MKKIIEVTLPKLGESILAATVIEIFKKEGDFIQEDEPLLEVSTDKVNSEIPSPVSGVIKEILVKVDQEIPIETPIVKIELGIETLTSLKSETISQIDSDGIGQEKENLLTPAVLRLAQIKGISLETLHTIYGTGQDGRITKKDIENYIDSKESSSIEKTEEEKIPLSGMRKMIADNMVRSFYQAPHASLVSEADVTDIIHLIQEKKEEFKQTHGFKLTITSFLIQAMTKALEQFPMLNASLEGETIIMKRLINIGIAVNVDKGLIVPVIKNCQTRNLVSFASAVAELASLARKNQLSPEAISDGTITMTNFGMTGALMGIPIIRYPEVAIIGAGTIQKRVVVRENQMTIRQMIYITLTFDHRLIDGIYGCQFLDAFKNYLESHHSLKSL
ncbi:MAG: dihydrolipoamide acetyltransferase family protein [Chlamydiales bacterium]